MPPKCRKCGGMLYQTPDGDIKCTGCDYHLKLKTAVINLTIPITKHKEK